MSLTLSTGAAGFPGCMRGPQRADTVAAHHHSRRTRDHLLRTHPDSPIPQGRGELTRRAGRALRSALGFKVTIDSDVPPRHLEVGTGSNGVARFDPIGCAHLPGTGTPPA